MNSYHASWQTSGKDPYAPRCFYNDPTLRYRTDFDIAGELSKVGTSIAGDQHLTQSVTGLDRKTLHFWRPVGSVDQIAVSGNGDVDIPAPVVANLADSIAVTVSTYGLEAEPIRHMEFGTDVKPTILTRIVSPDQTVDIATVDGRTTRTNSLTTVADAPLAIDLRSVQPETEQTGKPFDFTVSVSNANPHAKADNFTAVIDWGDGSKPSIAIAGVYSIIVQFTDVGGSTASAKATVTVIDPWSAATSMVWNSNPTPGDVIATYTNIEDFCDDPFVEWYWATGTTRETIVGEPRIVSQAQKSVGGLGGLLPLASRNPYVRHMALVTISGCTGRTRPVLPDISIPGL